MEWKQPWLPHREDLSLKKFISGIDLDAAGVKVL